MAAETDVYGCLAETLDGRLRALSGAAPGESTPDPQEEIRRLEVDRSEVRAHSGLADQPVTYGQATFCQECGEPAPCGTIRRLAERYGCAGG